METSVKFWENADINKLAKHWKYEEKLPYDIEGVLPHVVGCRKVWDVAAGDDRILGGVRKAIEDVITVSSDLVPAAKHIEKWNIVGGVLPKAEDSDVVLMLGVIQYLNDKELREFLKKVRNKKVIIKSPCYVVDKYVCAESEEMGGVYQSYYRSAERIMDILGSTHHIGHVGRVYPDHMESKFGSVQMLFVGEVVRTGLTFGVWDMLHYGHVRFLERAKEKVDTLIVGVCGDEVNKIIKGRYPVIEEGHREYLVKSLKAVDETFVYKNMEYNLRENVNVLIVGEEFGGQGVPNHITLLDKCADRGVEVIRIGRTPDISSSQIRNSIL